jgi:hypothetical protein
MLPTFILFLGLSIYASAQNASEREALGCNQRVLIGHYYCSGPPGFATVYFDGILGPRLSSAEKLQCTGPDVEDCQELSEKVKKRVEALGCKASPLPQTSAFWFDFVCSGGHDDLIDIISAVCRRIIIPLPSGTKEDSQ